MTKRILVVEDQEDLRGVLRTLLTGSGYEMIEAADGEAGVAQAKAQRPDLILMDTQMPVLHLIVAMRLVHDMAKTAGRGHGDHPWAAR
jgi:CheY-like chemotaxis protein